MQTSSVRRVPWTCRWSRFGGPVPMSCGTTPGFVFWVCRYPDEPHPRLLQRGTCEGCPRWEAAERVKDLS